MDRFKDTSDLTIVARISRGVGNAILSHEEIFTVKSTHETFRRRTSLKHGIPFNFAISFTCPDKGVIALKQLFLDIYGRAMSKWLDQSGVLDVGIPESTLADSLRSQDLWEGNTIISRTWLIFGRSRHLVKG